MVFHGDTEPIGSPTLRVRFFAIPYNAASTKKQGRYYGIYKTLPGNLRYIMKYEKNIP